MFHQTNRGNGPMTKDKKATRRVALIRIQNILGIDELEITPGEHGVLIEGGNATGKTSVVEAIRAVAKGGHDATLIRHGAEEGSVVFVFDDDSSIQKTVSRDESDTAAKHPETGRIGAPKKWLDGLLDMLSLNPIDIITKSASERVDAFLEAVPMEADAAAIKSAVRGTGVVVPNIPAGTHALRALAYVRKDVYDRRRDVNRDVKQLQAATTQLESSVAKVEDDTGLGALQRACDEARLAYHEANGALQIGKERAKAAERARGVQDVIVGNHERIEEGGLRSDRMTTAIAKLDSLKTEAVEGLPIEGVEIADDDIVIHGVPFGRLNTAAQYRFVFEVAKLRAGAVPLVCLDGLERLEPKAFDVFMSELEASGLQGVVTRVTEGPLDVTAIN